MSREIIERYASGADAPGRAIQGLTGADMAAFPVPGTWSIHQIIVHLMESDLIATDRFKRIASMNNPLILSYDETAFIRALHPEVVDAREACELFRLNRLVTAKVLHALPPEAWERTGVHNDLGKRTLRQFVQGYADHLDHHLKFLFDKRALLGKPLAR